MREAGESDQLNAVAAGRPPQLSLRRAPVHVRHL